MLSGKVNGVNDENSILIQGNRDLASQYAGKIMEIYSQYRWRVSPTTTNGRLRTQAKRTISGDCANSTFGSEQPQ
jgi:hypothetical protein